MRSFLPTASLETLAVRASMLRELRRFFDERGFLEVETPMLSADTVVDRHLDPFAVSVTSGSTVDTGAMGATYWLQTSPEFGMKRLLAAGATAIYQVTRAFRREEQGPLHNPEFTMVEWYRCGDQMSQGMQLLSDLSEQMLRRGSAITRTYREVFESTLGVNPHRASCEQLRDLAESCQLSIPESFVDADRDAWLDLLLAERIQPTLGTAQPVIVHDYPASQSALARIRQDDDVVAERFELFVDGIEMANGYHELLDADELASRQEIANQLRRQDGKQALPEDNRLLSAMRHGLPPCVGVALGFDRLVMVATGAQRLADVMAFPFERA